MRYVQIIITGKVQGVFYRASAKKAAEELGIHGWVKNNPAGDVEIYACGNPAELEKFLSWCRKGPARAVVQAVDVKEAKPQSCPDFRIVK